MTFAGWSVRSVVRGWVQVACLFVGMTLLSGCADSYPESMEYPPRKDWLVVEQPKPQDPLTRPDRPGQLLITNLNDPQSLLYDYRDRQLDPAKLSPGDARAIQAGLVKMFGTPAQPKVDGIDDPEQMAAVQKDLRLEPTFLAEGSKLYRIHCLHCHGLTGDGLGPTGAWVNPHPRDYRQGVFKFTSSNQDEGVRKPRRDDLLRTLRQGIEGTSMPSFGLLSDKELDALVSYVIHLSLRGQVEFNVIRDALTLTGNIDENLQAYLANFATNWQEAQKPTSLILPVPYPYTPEQLGESVKRGFEAFKSADQGNCVACHKDYGREALYQYDVWGTLVRPANLTNSIYRGGRRPIDLYWRIHGGIGGSGMVASPKLQVWDLVNFVQILPYRELREKYGVVLD